MKLLQDSNTSALWRLGTFYILRQAQHNLDLGLGRGRTGCSNGCSGGTTAGTDMNANPIAVVAAARVITLAAGTEEVAVRPLLFLAPLPCLCLGSLASFLSLGSLSESGKLLGYTILFSHKDNGPHVSGKMLDL